jgi:hypothetical protein
MPHAYASLFASVERGTTTAPAPSAKSKNAVALQVLCMGIADSTSRPTLKVLLDRCKRSRMSTYREPLFILFPVASPLIGAGRLPCARLAAELACSG